MEAYVINGNNYVKLRDMGKAVGFRGLLGQRCQVCAGEIRRLSYFRAIVAVLISVAVPVLSSQLERSREAVDLANVRSAYAQVSTEALIATPAEGLSGRFVKIDRETLRCDSRRYRPRLLHQLLPCPGLLSDIDAFDKDPPARHRITS